MDEGPHEVGKTIIFECFIDRIYPSISMTAFNVTFEKADKIFHGEVGPVSAGVFQFKINGSFKAAMEFNNDTAICQLTTLGHYYKEKKHLGIYGKLIKILSYVSL